jgi:hypothetical protein
VSEFILSRPVGCMASLCCSPPALLETEPLFQGRVGSAAERCRRTDVGSPTWETPVKEPIIFQPCERVLNRHVAWIWCRAERYKPALSSSLRSVGA